MYMVIEFQKSATDTMTALVNVYEDRSDAEQKYHDILRYAAKTTMLKHGAVMLTEDGAYIKNEPYGVDSNAGEE